MDVFALLLATLDCTTHVVCVLPLRHTTQAIRKQRAGSLCSAAADAALCRFYCALELADTDTSQRPTPASLLWAPIHSFPSNQRQQPLDNIQGRPIPLLSPIAFTGPALFKRSYRSMVSSTNISWLRCCLRHPRTLPQRKFATQSCPSLLTVRLTLNGNLFARLDRAATTTYACDK